MPAKTLGGAEFFDRNADAIAAELIDGVFANQPIETEPSKRLIDFSIATGSMALAHYPSPTESLN